MEDNEDVLNSEPDVTPLSTQNNAKKPPKSTKSPKQNHPLKPSKEYNSDYTAERQSDEVLTQYFEDIAGELKENVSLSKETESVEEGNDQNGEETQKSNSETKEPVEKTIGESNNEEESGVIPRNNEHEQHGHKEQGTKKHKDLINHKTQPENVGREHHAVSASTSRPPVKGSLGPNPWHKIGTSGQGPPKPIQPTSKSSNESGPTAIPIEEECTSPGKSFKVICITYYLINSFIFLNNKVKLGTTTTFS